MYIDKTPEIHLVESLSIFFVLFLVKHNTNHHARY